MAAKPSLAEEIRMLPGYDPYRNADAFHFDEKAAQRVIDFIEQCLTHVEGKLAGKPYLLAPHEKALVANVFGWKRKDGRRRYTEVFYFVPRKNSKSTLAACIVNVMLFLDKEPGAQIYSAAADREQAGIVFRIAQAQIHNEPELESRCQIYRKRIVMPERNAFYQAISADAHTKHGYNTSCAIIDELHAMPNRDLVDVLQTSRGARTEPLFIYTTTSDFERDGSICNEMHEYAKQVRDGIIENPHFLPIIFEATKDDDWTDPDIWAQVNPNLSRSIDFAFLETECAKAKASPNYENTFKRLYLNIRTEQRDRWLQLDKWDACGADVESPAAWREETIQRLGGCKCVGALDIGQVSDLTALVLLFLEPKGVYTVLPWFWLPRGTAAELERRGKPERMTWIREGFITATDGNETDYTVVERDIVALCKQFKVTALPTDRYFQGVELSQRLFQNHNIPIEDFGTGTASMSAPCHRLEELIAARQLNHGMNPVLRWMASNVMLYRDTSGGMKPDRSDARTQKIDGIVAMLMALGKLMQTGVKATTGNLVVVI